MVCVCVLGYDSGWGDDGCWLAGYIIYWTCNYLPKQNYRGKVLRQYLLEVLWLQPVACEFSTNNRNRGKWLA